MKIVDTHCHLVSEKLQPHFGDFVARAKAAGVAKIINIAYCPDSVKLAVEQSTREPSVYCALGIQPHDANTFTVPAGLEIETLAQTNKKVVAVGEIGLDAYHRIVDMEKQVECFEWFLEMALRQKLPVAVHVRETHEAVYSRLKSFALAGGKGEIHCFTGTKAEAANFLDLDFFLSFSGIVTFKNSLELKEVAKYVPHNRYLVETDSPYLAPVPHRGKQNEPAFTLQVCEHMATLRSVTVEQVAEESWGNSHELFPRLKDF